jgi:anti-sigma regulatory factor (Ser/Thr protein kinase)
MAQTDSLTVPGRYDQIQYACDFISAGARLAGFDSDTIFQLQLATDEACTNVIEHAYGAEDVGSLVISWHIQSDDFVVRIRDNGRAFNPDNVPLPVIPKPPAKDTPQTTASMDNDPEDEFEIKVGGLGLYFMRKLMDGVEFRFDHDNGNTLTMTKRLPG